MSEPNNSADGGRPDPGTFEALGKKIDQRPEVRAAEEALRKARAQLERAQAEYHDVRSQAEESLDEVRQRNVGDLISGTIELVRKHPGPGVLVALALGWFAGRIFRR